MNKSSIPSAQKTVLSLLLDDHRKVQKLFKEFKKEQDRQLKEDIVREACMELTVHTQLEEQLFYPFLRQADLEAFGEMLDEANVEHATAKSLVTQLEGMTAEDPLFDAKFTVLAEYVNHHIDEEEEELFPKVIVKKIDLRELGSAMEMRKEEIASAALAV